MKSPESPSTAPAGKFIRLSVSALICGKVHPFGEPIPLDDLPKVFERYIVQPGPPEPSQRRQLNFRLNEKYSISVDADGNKLPSLERQAAELERHGLLQEAAEEALSQPPDEALAAAMAQAQDAYDADIGRQLAQAEFTAKQNDAARQAAEEFNNEQSGESGYQEGQEQFTPEPVESKPKLRRRFVRRGVLYRRARDQNIKLKAGEKVFVQTATGYSEIGIVSGAGVLPVSYVTKQRRKLNDTV